jgi:hypothetical protein
MALVSRQNVFLYGCENLEGIALENCFMIKCKILFSKFFVPKDLVKNNFKGDVKVL